MFPDLWTGTMDASFHASGNTPLARERLKMIVTVITILVALCLINDGGKSSGPEPFDGSTVSSALWKPPAVVDADHNMEFYPETCLSVRGLRCYMNTTEKLSKKVC